MKFAALLSQKLEAGKYVVIPTTFDAGEIGKFTLSVSTKSVAPNLKLL